MSMAICRDWPCECTCAYVLELLLPFDIWEKDNRTVLLEFVGVTNRPLSTRFNARVFSGLSL